ncbi:hypothetical protein OZX67_05125 [Bifidobacterium sp. ESL0728]|uniref:hypothetical protein n=1 Tax=Bifidobacterium sp. ESL0728 TaxID=2983220 RepID=UPI0023F6BD2C|nr:hypothetical protein [Bifidobacterium sp. ESL0728]WEV58225.1 hypothetical protein OZX67_05125 [Bifidobacterium sp. ESL0728]
MAILCSLPIKHRAHADIITQTQALFNSDPDHVQQAITRSGNTNIKLSSFDDPGNHRIFKITVKAHGFLAEFNEPTNCEGYSSGVRGTCTSVLISRKPFQDPTAADTSVDISNKSAILDPTDAETVQHTLHMNQHQLEDFAIRVVWDVIDTVSDNW